jgi:hypothetical protein
MAQIFSLITQAIQENTQDQATKQLKNLLELDAPRSFVALIRTLQSILAGNRDPDLAADPGLDYRSAAELRLLLEALAQTNA